MIVYVNSHNESSVKTKKYQYIRRPIEDLRLTHLIIIFK